MDGLVNCVYEFRNKKIKQHLGGIYDFLEKKKIESLKELEVIGTNNKPGNVNGAKNESTVELSFQERKEISKNISRLEKQVEKTELEIESIEQENARLENVLASPDKLEDHSIFEKYETQKIILINAMKKWEELNEELENWKIKKSW